MKNLALICLMLFALNSYATIGAGGYVPFGTSTQADTTGGSETLGFQPFISVNTIMPGIFDHLFMPEFGYVFHSGKDDDFSKTTLFFLFDLGNRVNSQMVIRYGLGVFMTKIGGDGAQVTVRNGTGTSTAFRPNETVTSYNTTVNFGADFALNSEYTLKFETYLFEILSSDKRDVSYSLSFNYHM